MEDVIHCIGDSHACFFSGVAVSRLPWPAISPDKIPLFKTYWLGAFLAYNLKNKKTLYKALRDIPKSENIMFIFGEIDCRAHLVKEAKASKRQLSEVAKECVERYMEAIKKVRMAGYKKILIFAPIPSTKFEGPLDNIYPTSGTSRERNEATKLFNGHLQKLADQLHIPVINIFDKLIDGNGSTNAYYYRDRIHLSQRIMPEVIREIYVRKIGKLNLFENQFLNNLPAHIKILLFRVICNIR